MPPNLSRRAAVTLLELEEDPRLILRSDADPGIAHRKSHGIRPLARFDDDRDAARFRELDGVAGKVEQHLAQPRRVADDLPRQPLVDEAADLEPLRLRARPEQLGRLLDKGGKRERTRRQVDAAGLDLGEIEDFLDQRQQRVARGLHCLDVGRLLGGQRRVGEKVRHAEDAVERRADLVRHHRQEVGFGAVGRLGLVARLFQRALGVGAVGDVAADALHFAADIAAHGDLVPGDPARALRGRDLLVVDARAVGQEAGLALGVDGERNRSSQQLGAVAAGQRAEGVVGVGDRAFGVAAHDHVALRLEEAPGAFLRFADFPVAVGRLFEPRLEVAQLRLHLPDAGNQDTQGAAGGAEQRRNADGERVRIVMRARRHGSRHEAERGAERHRRDHDRADDEGEQPTGKNGRSAEDGARAHGPFRSARRSRLSTTSRQCWALVSTLL